MKVILNSITGIEDAIEAMYFSKRTWDEKLHLHIREVCSKVIDRNGFLYETQDEKTLEEFNGWLNTVVKMTKRHITIGRYIDFSFTVVGLHRGGQDDWDAHTKRFNNRIIRNSTRLATYGANEKSNYYKDKIITTSEALDILHIITPETITVTNEKYVKCVNGYVKEEFLNNKDVLRGLYMLSIPSDFTYKIDLTEFSHVYKERGEHGTANPEVKDCAEISLLKLNTAHKQFDRQLMLDIKN